MKLLGSLILVLLLSEVCAQKFPSDFWHDGKLVLEAGDTLRGNIKYDLQTDLLQLDKDGRLASYTARKVVFFEIFDKGANRYRTFYSLPYATSGQYKAPVFFELLAEGKMTLLCREAIEFRNYPSSFYYYGTSTRLVLVHKYFMLRENGSIEPFVGKRDDLIEMMGNKGEMVQKYAKSNRLGVENKYQISDIVKYYNSLF